MKPKMLLLLSVSLNAPSRSSGIRETQQLRPRATEDCPNAILQMSKEFLSPGCVIFRSHIISYPAKAHMVEPEKTLWESSNTLTCSVLPLRWRFSVSFSLSQSFHQSSTPKQQNPFCNKVKIRTSKWTAAGLVRCLSCNSGAHLQWKFHGLRCEIWFQSVPRNP